MKEFWIIDDRTRTANFYALDENGRYKMLALSNEDKFESRVLPELLLDANWLWREDLPNLRNALKDWKLV